MKNKDNKKSSVLKIISGIIAFAIVWLVADFFLSDDSWNTVVTEIHEGCYIECLDDNMQSIYYYPDGDKTENRKYIVNKWESVVMYATDGKDTVAVHYIFNKSEENEEDKFIIFNTETEEEISFFTQAEMFEFCEREGIILNSPQQAHCKGIIC